MKVLLADDELGIREGLASFLRLKGVEVCTAGRCDEALSLLAGERFDVVLTDWHLEDGVAAAIVDRSTAPVVVVSGYPEEVAGGPQLARVLSKPVAPAAMLDELRACCAPEPTQEPVTSTCPAAPGRDGVDPLESLPEDARRRIQLILEWSGAIDHGAAFTVRDEGRTVTLEVVWPEGRDPTEDDDPSLDQLVAWIGGDLRVLCRDSRQHLEYRILRDGAPESGLQRVDPEGDWPDGPCRLDLDGVAMTPASFLAVLRRLAHRDASLGTVHVLNVPPRLRLLAEASGHGASLPKREPVAPRIPEVLTALWN